MTGSSRPFVQGPRRDLLLVAGATVACLLPFVGKPFHIDDPVYLWVARHIQSHPLDFYGFTANWHGAVQGMAEINKNPPLASFFLAAAAALVGWSEAALHTAMLIPAVALVLGVQALSHRLAPPGTGSAARLVALLLLTLPVFVVSATSLMADVPAAALWCWAVVLWLRGLEERRLGWLLASAVLVTACALTKYVGIALILLLAAYALVRERRVGPWVLALLLPIALLAGYDFWMRELYGVAPLTGVASYAAGYRADGVAPALRGLVGLSFLGGGFLGLTLLVPWLWGWRAALGWLAMLGLVILGCSRLGSAGTLALRDETGTRWLLVCQLALFAWAGLHLLGLAVRDGLRHRDAGSWLLGLWLVGIFVFAAVLNWTTNARSLLPAVPAAALLVARGLAARRAVVGSWGRVARISALALGLAIAWAVAWADLRHAQSARAAAHELMARHRPEQGAVWFLGSWGFQYYMETQGATRLDLQDAELLPGDVVIVATNNSTGGMVPPGILVLRERAEFPLGRWITVLSAPLGAGFYSDIWGPLPFALGDVPPDVYLVGEVRVPARLRGRLR